MSLGTLVYDERIVPISDIRLEGDEIVFYGELHGTLPAMNARGVVIFSPEGKIVMRVPNLRCDMPPTVDGTLSVRQPVQITQARRG